MSKHRRLKDIDEASAEPAEGSLTLDKVKAESAIGLKTPSPPPVKSRTKREAGEVKAPNFIQNFIEFLISAKRELRKVTWPTRDETFKSTGVLLVFVIISAVYLALVDGVLTRILRLIVG